MEILHNNFTGLTAGTSQEISTYIEEQEKEQAKGGKLTNFLDNFFGYADTASQIYGNIKRPGDDEPKPYDLDVHVGDRPQGGKRVLGMPAMTGYIVIGMVVVIGGVLVYKQVKK